MPSRYTYFFQGQSVTLTMESFAHSWDFPNSDVCRWSARAVPFSCEHPSLFHSPAIIKAYIAPQGMLMRTKQGDICKKHRRPGALLYPGCKLSVQLRGLHINTELQFSRFVRKKTSAEKYSSLKYTSLHFTPQRGEGLGKASVADRSEGECVCVCVKFCLFSSDQCSLLV